MELYILLFIILISALVKKIPSYIPTIGILTIITATYITTVAEGLRHEIMTAFEPLLKYKNTCHLDYSLLNSSEFFRSKKVKLDCSKIYMLDEINSPLYQLSNKISLTNLFLKKETKKDLITILKSIPYEHEIKDLDNDGFVTKKEQNEYTRVHGEKDLLLEEKFLRINCDKLNLSLNYCNYEEFKKNFSLYSQIIMKQFLDNKAIPFTVLN